MDYHIAAHSVHHTSRNNYEVIRLTRQTTRGNITSQPVDIIEQEQICSVRYQGHPLTRHMCDWHDCFIVWSSRGD